MLKHFWRYGHIIVLILIMIFAYIAIYRFDLITPKTYDGKDFGINYIASDLDTDNDGIEDYQDILEGAREFVAKKPKYKSKYYSGGYPDDEYAVCTDVIWYALKNAGYNIKDLIDADILKDKNAYNIDKQDKNIDFRRVRNLKVFLDKYAEKLGTEISDIDIWQGGDIVVYNNHIGIVSDKRNKKGVPYLIHHAGQVKYEENALDWGDVIGHYRFKLNTNIDTILQK